MADVKHKRGSRAAFNALKAANGLVAGQIYYITDENKLAMADTVNAATEYSANLANWTESTNTYSSRVGVRFVATNASSNVDTVISPKGTGAFYLGPTADGTATGGNNRGNQSVDLQTNRNANTKVASGIYSFIGAGQNNTASGGHSAAFCDSTTASGYATFTFGANGVTASANFSVASGSYSLANKSGQSARAGGGFSSTQGTAQTSDFVLRNTGNNNTVELFLDGTSARLTLQNNSDNMLEVMITGRQSAGGSTASFRRQLTITKDGTAASTALIGSVDIIGTDQNPSALTAPTITADTTNGSVKIEVSSNANNWRWVAYVRMVEVVYA